jgi:hypothetical protein
MDTPCLIASVFMYHQYPSARIVLIDTSCVQVMQLGYCHPGVTKMKIAPISPGLHTAGDTQTGVGGAQQGAPSLARQW